MLFGIVQGGDIPELRHAQRARRWSTIGFHGYAIGGLAVGEPQAVMLAMLDETAPALPTDRPRYLMGVGTPDDILEAVARGIDMFDCVMPTRNGRHGVAFTRFGQVNLRNARHADDPRPLDEESGWPPARNYARAYLHHLVKVGRDAGRDAAVGDQYRLLPAPDAGIRDAIATRHIRPISRTHEERLGEGRHSAALEHERLVTREALERVLGHKTVTAGVAGPEIADEIVRADRRTLRRPPSSRHRQDTSADRSRADRDMSGTVDRTSATADIVTSLRSKSLRSTIHRYR